MAEEKTPPPVFGPKGRSPAGSEATHQQGKETGGLRPPKTGGGEIKGFEQAKKELDQLLQEFDRDEINLDNLVPRLKRAKELIDFCTKRIKQIEVEAKEIVKAIEPRESQRGEPDSKDDEPPF